MSSPDRPHRSPRWMASLVAVCFLSLALAACQSFQRSRQKISLAGALAGFSPAASVTPGTAVSVPMLPRENGHLVPFLSGRLNGGTPLSFMLDTGANHTLVSSRAAKEGQLVSLRKLGGTITNAFGQQKASQGALIEMFSLGSLTFSQVPVMVHSFTGRGADDGTGDSLNVLGTPLLGLFSYVTVDYGRGEVVFCHQQMFPGSRHPGCVVLPMDINADGHITAPFVLSGLGQIDAVIDTGCDNGVLVRKSDISRLGWDESFSQGYVTEALAPGMTSSGIAFVVPHIEAGGQRFNAVPAWAGEGSDPLLIGSGFLQRFRTTFDFQRMQLWLEPRS